MPEPESRQNVFVEALMEMPEYRDETFGIISMLGDEQVKLIEKLLFEHISLVDRENRRIRCGTASNFQGDERSVVFLSLVDSNEGDGPLRMMTEGKGDSTKQRYNVAVSRAQNQIWIVYSMDPAASLKTGDIRRGLLDYAKDPNSYRQKLKQVERDSESPFEEEVAKSLVTSGYQVTQQYPVGGYRLDMVVSCNGKRIWNAMGSVIIAVWKESGTIWNGKTYWSGWDGNSSVCAAASITVISSVLSSESSRT